MESFSSHRTVQMLKHLRKKTQKGNYNTDNNRYEQQEHITFLTSVALSVNFPPLISLIMSSMAAEMSEANQQWISTQYVANRFMGGQHNHKWQHVTWC